MGWERVVASNELSVAGNGPGPLALDDRARLLMLGIANVGLAGIVYFTIGCVSQVMTKGEKPQSLSPSDIRTFLLIELAIVAVSLGSSIWDWRHQIWALMIWAAVYIVNRKNG